MIGLLAAAAVLAAPAPPVAAEPTPDPRASLAELQRVYEQSCAERAYGSYNDLCEAMRRELADYRRTLARERRSRAPVSAAPAGSSVTLAAPTVLGAPAPLAPPP